MKFDVLYKVAVAVLLANAPMVQANTVESSTDVAMLLTIGSNFEPCGWTTLFDGGSQYFCIKSDAGSQFDLWFNQSPVLDNYCGFYLVGKNGVRVNIVKYSVSESTILNNIQTWVKRKYSKSDLERINQEVEEYYSRLKKNYNELIDSPPKKHLNVLALADLSGLVETIRSSSLCK